MIKDKILRRLGVGISYIINLISEWPAVIAIIALVAIIVISVMARYAFNFPFHFADEYSGYLMVLIVFFPLSFALRHGRHIRIDLLNLYLSRRTSDYLDLVTDILSLPVIILLLVSSIQITMRSFARGIKARTLMETPLGPVQLILVIGLILFGIQMLIRIINSIRALRHNVKN